MELSECYMLASYLTSFVFLLCLVLVYVMILNLWSNNQCDLSVKSVNYILVWCRIPNKLVVVRFWGLNATVEVSARSCSEQRLVIEVTMKKLYINRERERDSRRKQGQTTSR